MKKHQKQYACYTELGPEKVMPEGAITGSKKDVLAWMRAKYGKLSEAEMVQAEAFFYDGDCTEFSCKDGSSVFLAEILEDDLGAEKEEHEAKAARGTSKKKAAKSPLRYEIVDGEVAITGCADDAKGAVVIPKDMEGHPVTSIKWCAFNEAGRIESVTLPTSMTSVDRGAFMDCKGLKSVTMSSSVTSIDSRAFTGCVALKSVTLPPRVKSIGDYAFWQCGLKSVRIPASVKSIGEHAFPPLVEFVVDPANKVYASKNGMLLTKDGKTLVAGVCGNAVIPEGVTCIAEKAFAENQGLKSVMIPTSVKSIGAEAFKSCKGLKSVTIPAGVTTIGKEAFRFCKGLSSVAIGKDVTSIGERAFSGCTIKSVTIPEGVKSIGNSAFAGCPLLESVMISPGVKKIGRRAFSNCRSLKCVTIPASVTSIADDAFHRIGSAVKVVVE